MKYIIDLDALKDCLKLLPNPTILNGDVCVRLDDVNVMIDKFPKDEYGGTVYRDLLNAARKTSANEDLSCNDWKAIGDPSFTCVDISKLIKNIEEGKMNK